MRSQLEMDMMALIEPVIVAQGYEMVDVEIERQGKDSVLRVFINCDGGVSIEDCRKVSHSLDELMESTEIIKSSFILEISSPGIERRLRTAEHFRKYLRHSIELRLDEKIGGRKNIKGQLASVENDSIEVIIGNSTKLVIPLNNIKKAHLAVDWKQVLQQAKQ